MSRRVRAWRLSTALLALGVLIVAAILSGWGVALANHNFSDVPNSVFYHDFVDFLVQNGITAGCGGGQFCGESAVTRGQMAVFLQKLAVALGNCPPDTVKVGPACVDKYEASVWRTQNAPLIQKIRLGTVTGADLTAAGAVQLGLAFGDLAAAGCPVTGNGCVDVYAVSIPGVLPSWGISWFQAAATARNAGKRLPTNAEWQAAALGTPDGVSCNTSSGAVAATGAAAGCVSDAGAFDMVGNLFEWVADWVPRSMGLGSWGFSDDYQGLVDAATTGAPGALLRGGAFASGTGAGVFTVLGFDLYPLNAFNNIGFRAAR